MVRLECFRLLKLMKVFRPVLFSSHNMFFPVKKRRERKRRVKLFLEQSHQKIPGFPGKLENKIFLGLVVVYDWHFFFRSLTKGAN